MLEVSLLGSAPLADAVPEDAGADTEADGELPEDAPLASVSPLGEVESPLGCVVSPLDWVDSPLGVVVTSLDCVGSPLG